MNSSTNSPNKLSFMDGAKILIKKIPKYPLFEGNFIESVDYTLCKMIIDKPDTFSPETITGFNTAVMTKLRTNGDLQVKHNQRYGLGRFYADNNVSFIPHQREIKHTLFSYAGWVDLDMIKGHPSIALEIFKGILDLPTIQKYVDSFDNIVSNLSAFYKTDSDPLTTDNIKWLFNMIIYGGTPNGWKNKLALGGSGYIGKNIIGFIGHHPFVLAFEKECLTMSDMVFKSNSSIVNKIRQPLDTLRDAKNSTISYFFQIVENHLVYIAYELLIALGIITPRKCGLEYDGLNIPPNGSVMNQDETISVLNNFILSKSGLNIKFKFKKYGDSVIQDLIDIRKQMVVAVPILDDVVEEIVVDENRETSQEIYNRLVVNFELTHTKIINDSFYVKDTGDSIIIMNRQKLVASYEHMECGFDSNKNPVSFIHKWMTFNDSIKKKDFMEIYPDNTKCPETAFNLWRPFAMEKFTGVCFKRKQTGLDFILNHIKILCDYDEVLYTYFIGWLAYMIQYPDKKIPCIVLISKQGAGKTSLILWLKEMMGEKKVFECADPARDVWGDFNSLMMDAFLVNLSEIEFADSKDAVGKFKALITDTTININQKNVSQITVASHHHFIVTTNNDNPLSIKKDDRRFVIARSSDDKIGNVEHFNTLHGLLDDHDFIRTSYSYLKNYDLTGFDPKNIPQTEHLTGLKDMATSPIEDWLRDYTYENKNNLNVITLNGRGILKLFKDWLDVVGRKFDTNEQKIGVKLTNLRINGIGKGERDNKGLNTKSFNFTLLKAHFNME